MTKNGRDSPSTATALDRERIETIARLEAAFDAHLPVTRLEPPSRALWTAAQDWSARVWQTAEALGPSELDADTIARGLDLAARPVFVCGVHRSGTTLVRDLLDGHPSLLVLPSEGSFQQGTAGVLERMLPAERAGVVGREWLRRLANPINQPPYWMLGRTGERGSPYVRFAQALLAWWPLTERRFGREVSLWPLSAVVLAYASASTEPETWSQLVRWVEKSPTNELQLARLRAEFPDARFVHVVRHPLAVFASRKAIERRTRATFRSMRQALKDLRATYRVALEETSRPGRGDYCLVRYERLIASPPDVMHEVAHALGIAFAPAMLEPTVAGRPSAANSSFDAGSRAGEMVSDARPIDHGLSPYERNLVIAAAGQRAAALGYSMDELSPWRTLLLRARSGIW